MTLTTKEQESPGNSAHTDRTYMTPPPPLRRPGGTPSASSCLNHYNEFNRSRSSGDV